MSSNDIFIRSVINGVRRTQPSEAAMASLDDLTTHRTDSQLQDHPSRVVTMWSTLGLLINTKSFSPACLSGEPVRHLVSALARFTREEDPEQMTADLLSSFREAAPLEFARIFIDVLAGCPRGDTSVLAIRMDALYGLLWLCGDNPASLRPAALYVVPHVVQAMGQPPDNAPEDEQYADYISREQVVAAEVLAAVIGKVGVQLRPDHQCFITAARRSSALPAEVFDALLAGGTSVPGTARPCAALESTVAILNGEGLTPEMQANAAWCETDMELAMALVDATTFAAADAGQTVLTEQCAVDALWTDFCAVVLRRVAEVVRSGPDGLTARGLPTDVARPAVAEALEVAECVGRNAAALHLMCPAQGADPAVTASLASFAKDLSESPLCKTSAIVLLAAVRAGVAAGGMEGVSAMPAPEVGAAAVTRIVEHSVAVTDVLSKRFAAAVEALGEEEALLLPEGAALLTALAALPLDDLSVVHLNATLDIVLDVAPFVTDALLADLAAPVTPAVPPTEDGPAQPAVSQGTMSYHAAAAITAGVAAMGEVLVKCAFKLSSFTMPAWALPSQPAVALPARKQPTTAEKQEATKPSAPVTPNPFAAFAPKSENSQTEQPPAPEQKPVVKTDVAPSSAPNPFAAFAPSANTAPAKSTQQEEAKAPAPANPFASFTAPAPAQAPAQAKSDDVPTPAANPFGAFSFGAPQPAGGTEKSQPTAAPGISGISGFSGFSGFGAPVQGFGAPAAPARPTVFARLIAALPHLHRFVTAPVHRRPLSGAGDAVADLVPGASRGSLAHAQDQALCATVDIVKAYGKSFKVDAAACDSMAAALTGIVSGTAWEEFVAFAEIAKGADEDGVPSMDPAVAAALSTHTVALYGLALFLGRAPDKEHRWPIARGVLDASLAVAAAQAAVAVRAVSHCPPQTKNTTLAGVHAVYTAARLFDFFPGAVTAPLCVLAYRGAVVVGASDVSHRLPVFHTAMQLLLFVALRQRSVFPQPIGDDLKAAVNAFLDFCRGRTWQVNASASGLFVELHQELMGAGSRADF